jgi:hypothetical protein
MMIMVSPVLLQQVSQLDRSAQVELIDFLYREIDDGTLDADTQAVLDDRLADLEMNPAAESPLAETLAVLHNRRDPTVVTRTVTGRH